MSLKANTLILLLVLMGIACKINKQGGLESSNAEERAVFTPGPPAIIYKTKADYSDKVAIVLDETRSRVISFPDPRDIARNGSYPYPTKLEGGYLLDNQGISKQVAFTSYSFKEYAALPQAPSAEELFNSVLEREPLLEMCHCGNRAAYQNTIVALNSLIKQGLTDCTPLVP